MALTKHFKETVAKRATEDPEFRQALLRDAINELITGDLDVAKLLLRDYINAGAHFVTLARRLKKNSKSIQRMLGPSGNPTAENLTALLKEIQKLEGIKVEIRLH